MSQCNMWNDQDDVNKDNQYDFNNNNLSSFDSKKNNYLYFMQMLAKGQLGAI